MFCCTRTRVHCCRDRLIELCRSNNSTNHNPKSFHMDQVCKHMKTYQGVFLHDVRLTPAYHWVALRWSWLDLKLLKLNFTHRWHSWIHKKKSTIGGYVQIHGLLLGWWKLLICTTKLDQHLPASWSPCCCSPFYASFPWWSEHTAHASQQDVHWYLGIGILALSQGISLHCQSHPAITPCFNSGERQTKLLYRSVQPLSHHTIM